MRVSYIVHGSLRSQLLMKLNEFHFLLSCYGFSDSPANGFRDFFSKFTKLISVCSLSNQPLLYNYSDFYRISRSSISIRQRIDS